MEHRCTGCGRPISGADVLYSATGAPLCPSCHPTDPATHPDLRGARRAPAAAGSALALALASFLFNPLFLPALAALAAAGYALTCLRPEDHRPPAARHPTGNSLVRTCAILAIVLASLRVLLALLMPAPPA